MAEIEWHDVQGLVRRALAEMHLATYVMLEIADPKLANTWLSTITDQIATGDDVGPKKKQRPDDHYINIALTHEGFKKLGMPGEGLKQFSSEFQEGMAPVSRNGVSELRRTGMLGDVGESHPSKWEWGGLQAEEEKGIEEQPVHILLMLFAATEQAREETISTLLGDKNRLSLSGLVCIKSLNAYLPDDKKEHFGFRDGISQPVIEGTEIEKKLSPASANLSVVKAGEFILGYENERGLLPVSPTIAPENHRNSNLSNEEELYDFGRNGTYLVCRQLEQDIDGFEDFLDRKTGRQSAGDGKAEKEKLAAKFIGRWPNGAPLTRYPEDPKKSAEYGDFDDKNPAHLNDFFFHTEDRDGLKCPVGAHIRRAYPRDSFPPNPRTALRHIKHHRILRRGRLYGPDRNENIAKKNTDGAETRGLMFICLNTDISGQFELIQHNWLNNPQFVGLYDERDPLLGQRSEGGTAMTIPHRPANARVTGMKDFVKVRGGAYFFLPGKKALSWLVKTNLSKQNS